MYEEVTGRKIHKFGFLYFDGWHLARKSAILTFGVLPKQDDWDNLGSNILDSCNISKIWFSSNVENSYIVIGSMDGNEDMHQTYIGEVSGPVINMNAYLSLMDGHHRVSVCVGLILFFLFFVYAYMLLERKSLTGYFYQVIPPMKNQKATISVGIIFNLISMIAFSSVMSILCIVIYEVFGEIYDIIITATVFQIIDCGLRLINKENKMTYE